MNSSNQKKVKILGVPVDLGSKPLGVEMGPAAIRYAGLIEALKCNGFDYSDYGDLRIDPSSGKDDPIAEIARFSEELAVLVGQGIEEGFIPVILGGDHSVSIGSIAGAAKKAEKLGLLWLDCHPDANTPETSPSGSIHGMTVAISLGYGYSRLVGCGGFQPKVAPENICIVGAKDVDKEEKAFLEGLGVRIFTLFDIERLGIVRVFEEALEIVSNQTDKIHLSFDVDVLDPVIAPGTGILSRGGLSYREILYIMKSLGADDRIGSIDLIEVNPLLDIRNQTSELAVELLLAALGGAYGDYERNYLKSGA
jgi:arginase